VFRRLIRAGSLVAPLIASIGLAFLLRSGLTFFVGFDQMSFRIPIARALVFGGVRIRPSDLWLVAVALTTLGGVLAVMFLLPIGRRMRAVADNPQLARVSGIRARPVMVTLWTLIGVCSAIGGLMLGLRTVVVPEMGWNLLLPAFAAAVLGGVGNPAGAVLAGIGLGLAEALSTPLVGFTYQSAIAFVLLIATLVVRPQGLLGRQEAVR